MTLEPIRIIDVIALPYSSWNTTLGYSLILSRMPVWRYQREGDRLTAEDDGFYDFLQGTEGKGDAFAGREFDITLIDGSIMHCAGRVWSVGPPDGLVRTVGVGHATIESLRQCHVYYSASIAIDKLQKWFLENVPSNNRFKYDNRDSVEWAMRLRGEGRLICANRARKLRRRGTTIWRDENGGRRWSPWYERRLVEIAERRLNDPGTVGYSP